MTIQRESGVSNDVVDVFVVRRCHTYLAVDVQLCVLALPFVSEQFSTQMTMILANGFRTRKWLAFASTCRSPSRGILSLRDTKVGFNAQHDALSSLIARKRVRTDLAAVGCRCDAFRGGDVCEVCGTLLNDIQQSHGPSWAESLDRTDARHASLEQLRVADPGAPNRVADSVVECLHARDGNQTALMCALSGVTGTRKGTGVSNDVVEIFVVKEVCHKNISTDVQLEVFGLPCPNAAGLVSEHLSTKDDHHSSHISSGREVAANS